MEVQESLRLYQILTLISGLTCGFAYGQVMITGKVVMRKCKDASTIGFFFLFIVGWFGVISFIVEVIREPNIVNQSTPFEYMIAVFIGIFVSLGIVCGNIATSIGNGGIAISIFNTNCVLVTTFNYLVFG